MAKSDRKTKLVKPKIQTTSFYDYIECRDYLQRKFGYDERDFSGKFTHRSESAPYQDFWHFVCDKFEPTNGDLIVFSNDTRRLCNEDWQKDILEHYLAEFGDKKNNREVTLRTYW